MHLVNLSRAYLQLTLLTVNAVEESRSLVHGTVDLDMRCIRLSVR